MTIRVAVADDHPTLLAGVEHLLSRNSGIALVGLVSSSTGLVELLGKTPCDVVVTDFSMPGGRYGDGLSLLRFLKRRFPAIRLVVFTSIENEAVMRSILGVDAAGIVSKSDPLEHVEAAIQAAYAGGRHWSPAVATLLEKVASHGEAEHASSLLSKRETEVLRLYAEGNSVTDIGRIAGRSSKTISAQKMAAMKKLNLKSDADIFKYAQANGLVNASQSTRQHAQKDDGAIGES